ncbi:MAG: hypothetical protein ACI9J3_002554 [Parvicellaceae bacterium]|jgi:hypothetical protein
MSKKRQTYRLWSTLLLIVVFSFGCKTDFLKRKIKVSVTVVEYGTNTKVPDATVYLYRLSSSSSGGLLTSGGYGKTNTYQTDQNGFLEFTVSDEKYKSHAIAAEGEFHWRGSKVTVENGKNELTLELAHI